MVKLIYIIIYFFLYSLVSSNEKIEINADQFTYDKENTRIYATGNVEIIDEEFKLYADKVFLNNESKVLSARDNATIFNSDGTILKAEKIVADQSLENAVIENSYLYIPGEEFEREKQFLKIGAKRVERRNRVWEKMEYGVFTACKPCYNEKTKKYDAPLVQLKAEKIIHDKKNLNVKYYDAYVDIKGKSVFYLPYFTVASPLVKRKAGILAPSFRQKHFFGFETDIPYYYPLSDYQDVTVIPKFSQKKNPALFIEHRKNFFNGEIKNEFSGTIENQKVNQVKKDKQRGHIKSIGSFDISKNSYVDYQIHRTTDRNYLNTYKYGYKDVLESNIKIESLRQNNFYSFQSYLFQDMRKEFNQRQTPKILPRLILDFNSDYNLNNLNYNTKIEFANIIRSDGNETKKLFFVQSLFYPTILPDGTFLKLTTDLNAGIYNIEKYENPENGRFEFNEYKTNYFPQISLEINKPFFRKKKNYVDIITPMANFVKGNKDAFSRKIPDESNINNFEFDFIDLFSMNRLSGNDRMDNLSRVDYGFTFIKKRFRDDKEMTIIEIGQSYQFEKHKYLDSNSGINDKFSDVVGKFQIVPHDSIKIDSFFSLDKEEYSLKTAYTNVLLHHKKSYLSFSNIHSPPVVNISGENEIEGKNQFAISYTQDIAKYWKLSGSTVFDKKNKIKLHNFGAKIRYEDECLGFSLNWNRQYTHNPEDPTSNNFTFLFSLKEIMENNL